MWPLRTLSPSAWIRPPVRLPSVGHLSCALFTECWRVLSTDLLLPELAELKFVQDRPPGGSVMVTARSSWPPGPRSGYEDPDAGGQTPKPGHSRRESAPGRRQNLGPITE